MPPYYQNNFQNQFQNPYQNQFMKQETVTEVNGRPGAEAYAMGPNCSALLLDKTAPLVWLKVTDGGGYATLTPYDITIHKTEAPTDYKSLEKRIERLEGMLNEQSNTGKAVTNASEHGSDAENGESR